MTDSATTDGANPYQSPSSDSTSAWQASSDDFQGVAVLLRQTKPWVRFISVLLFLGAGFMILIGAILGIGTAIGQLGSMGMVESVIFLVYVIMGGLYIAPAIYLWRYASRIESFVTGASMSNLASAIEAQKSFWRFAGMCAAVFLCLYFVVIVGAVAFGVVASVRP